MLDWFSQGDLSDESEVFQWILTQKNDESIEDVDRETFLEYINTKDFLAVVFCKIKFSFTEQWLEFIWLLDDEEDEKTTTRVLRHIELIDDEASEYGIRIVKASDDLMAKKFGYRNRPGITYFRKGVQSQWNINDWFLHQNSSQENQSTTTVTWMTRKRFWIGWQTPKIWKWLTVLSGPTGKCLKRLEKHRIIWRCFSVSFEVKFFH